VTVMDALVDLVNDGLLSAVVWVLPLVAAAAAASIAAGWLAARMGLVDPALGLVMRAAFVILALVLVGRSIGQGVQAFAAETFSRLPALGRGEPLP
jgi:type III secretory pathway component EscS